MKTAKRKSSPSLKVEPCSGVFDRSDSGPSSPVDAAFGGPELGNILTGLEANVNWLESLFATEFPRDDVREALADIREAGHRLLWFCREAAVITGADAFDLVMTPVEPVAALLQAAASLEERLGSTIAIDVASIPASTIRADHRLVVRMFERLLEALVRLAAPDARAGVYGFVGEETVRLIFAVSTERGTSSLGTLEERVATISRAIPMQFNDRVAQAHGGRIEVRRADSAVGFQVTLPLLLEDEATPSEAASA